MEILVGVYQQGNARKTLSVQQFLQKHTNLHVRTATNAQIRLPTQPCRTWIHGERNGYVLRSNLCISELRENNSNDRPNPGYSSSPTRNFQGTIHREIDR
jgi:hypothetical protein